MSENPLFEIEKLAFAYGRDPVIRDLSFSFGGGMTALLGPNGSGKTTLIKLLAGVSRPDSGKLRFKGRTLDRIPARERAREIAWLPQENEVLFPMRVEELLLLGRIPYAEGLGFESTEDRRVLERVLKLTGLTDLGQRYVETLSGGQRQAALLALRLAQQPSVLLLDEPQTHMDLSVQFRIADMLRTLATNEAMTILMATHDFNLAARFCDRIILLNEGGIAADGPPEAVLREDTLWKVFGCRTLVDKNPVTGHSRVTVLSH